MSRPPSSSTPGRRSGTVGRRTFLAGVSALAGAAALGAAGCSTSPATGPNELLLLSPPDETGTTQTLVDLFNARPGGRTQVVWQQAQPDMSAYLDQVRTRFIAGSQRADVIIGDVTWPAEMARSGWFVDISDRFPAAAQAQFLDGGITANTYQGRIYGVPWFNATAYLFYRADLLAKYGFAPPRTWDELTRQARTVVGAGDVPAGYLLQGAKYEGGSCNALEVLWNFGGQVLDPADPTTITIDGPAGLAAMRQYRELVAGGIAPQAVITYREQESYSLFFRGDALFMRNWSDFYGLIDDPTQSRLRPDQLGVTSLPAAQDGRVGESCLGGWNLFLNATSTKREQAWELVQFFSSPQAQKLRAIEGSFLPSRRALYDDPEVQRASPLTVAGRTSAETARSRPVSPVYSDLSLSMQESFGAILSGTESPEDGLSALAGNLREITRRAA